MPPFFRVNSADHAGADLNRIAHTPAMEFPMTIFKIPIAIALTLLVTAAAKAESGSPPKTTMGGPPEIYGKPGSEGNGPSRGISGQDSKQEKGKPSRSKDQPGKSKGSVGPNDPR
jgi:hypothetical protein